MIPDAGGITWLEVGCEEAELDRRLRGEQLPVRVADGMPGVHAMGIGEREFRTG